MATKTATTRIFKPAEQTEGPVLKPSVETTGPVKLEARSRQWRLIWEAREAQYAEVFGPAFPKGKVLLSPGAYATPKAAEQQGLCVMQYAPRPQRMSWIYVTHGLSQACFAGTHTPTRVELAVHWKFHDNELAVQILLGAARQILASGTPPAPEQVISGTRTEPLRAAELEHWLICVPDAAIPAHLEQPRQHMRVLLLLGVSDPEMQYALKVKPEMADGRQVLAEALHRGAVFPVTDTTRACLTRRRDFNRLWEAAFHRVHQRNLP